MCQPAMHEPQLIDSSMTIPGGLVPAGSDDDGASGSDDDGASGDDDASGSDDDYSSGWDDDIV